MNKPTTIADIKKELNKKLGDSVYIPDYDKNHTVDSISTGIMSLDAILDGINGIPLGRITEIYGKNSSGKSSLCLSIAREAQKRGFHVVYIDMEGTLTGKYIDSFGLDMDMFHVILPANGEDALETMRSFIPSEEVRVIIVDSVSSLVPESEQEGDVADHSVGRQALLMSKTLRMINPLVHRYNTAVIFINQTREKIGVMYGNPETTSGGVALPYYATLRIRTNTVAGDKIMEGTTKVGTYMTAVVIKNKLGAAGGKARYAYLYHEGFDSVSDLVDFAVLNTVITRSGSWYYYGDEQLAQGKPATVKRVFDYALLPE